MPTEIDKLQIEINAKATNANKAIDNLVVKLDALTSRLGKINGNNLVGLANGVNAFGNSVKTIGNIDSRKFERLATNITKISMLDTASINRASSAMHQLTRSLNSLGSVSQSAMQISQIASNVSKLGGVNVTRAITNLPLLTKELSKFMSVMAKSPQVSRNIIDMTNALANLSAQGRSVGATTNGLTNGLNKTNNVIRTTSKSTISLASAFGKFYATYFLVIRGIKGLLGSIEKTADYFEAFNYFNVAFNKIANEWKGDWEKYGEELGVATAEAYAESFTDRMEETFSKLSGIEFDIDKGLLSETGVKNLGLNIQKITQYASQLASVTNSLEFTGEASVATSQALVKLAGDISSLFNIDYDQVSSNLTSGMLGMSRSLYKYGIDITQATLQTKAYELGLSKAVSEMTQGEKAQLRLLAILDQSSIAWGDQANTINSLANQMRVLENTWSETSMIFGQLFVPMLENALPVINGLVIALRRLLIEIAGFMGVEIDPNKFNTGLNDNEDVLDGITQGFEDATAAAKEYENQILGFDEITKLQDKDANIGIGADGGSIDLTDEILDATSEYEKVWNEAYENMENRAEQWADKISEYFSINSWFDIGEDTSGLIASIFDFFTKAIEEVDWDEIGNNIGDFLKGVNWYDVLTKAFTLPFSIAELIADVWFGSFETAPIETSLLTAFAVLSFTSTGALIATNFKYAVIAAFVGYNLGNHIYELVTGEEVDYNWSNYLGKNFNLDEWITATVMSLEDLKNEWKDAIDIIEMWIGNWLSDNKELWQKGMFGIGTTVGSALGDLFDMFPNTLGKIRKTVGTQVVNIKELFVNGMYNMGSSIGSTLGNIKIKFSSTIDGIKSMFSKSNWTFSGIKDGLSSAFENAISALKEIWNTFAEWINDALKLEFEGFTKTFNMFGREINVGLPAFEVTLGKLPTFATGGFPEDGLFMANHNELVGQFANGRTAVANNAQIVEGIKYGVKEAVGDVLAPYLADIAESSRITANKEFGINEKTLFRSTQRQARNYTMQTGRPAF